MPLRAIAYPKSSSVDSLPVGNLANDSHPLLLVLLHGWGANAADVASMAPYLVPAANPNALEMRFPDAPFPHPMPGGRMWYGIPNDYTFGHPPADPHQQELIASRTQLMEWLQQLGTEHGIPLSHTILAGFSQGGAMALDVGTRLPLAGLMILSGYLHDDLQGRPSPLAPILLVHGRHDPVVPLAAAHQTRDRLQALGATVQYHELEMGHDIPLTVLELMQTFIGNCLKSIEKGTKEVF